MLQKQYKGITKNCTTTIFAKKKSVFFIFYPFVF